jgi:hypothetical protein
MRVALAAFAGALALAGCGGTGSGPSAAEAVPANAVGFLEVDADIRSDQWDQVQSLLDRFPSRPQLLEKLNEQLRKEGLEYERDVDAALGPTVAIVFPTSDEDEDAVLLTQPDDVDAWRALIDKAAKAEDEQYVLGEVDGWQAAAENQAALDALKNGEGSLAENAAFQEALEELPDDRLAYGWASGAGLRQRSQQLKFEWVAGAVAAEDDGARATFVSRGPSTGETYTSERVDDAPSDALAFLSFDADGLRAQASSFAPYAAMLGLPLDDLFEDIRGEAALWVRLSTGRPEITLVTDVADADRAQATLRRLLRDLPLELKLGVVDGQLVATTASSPEAALQHDEALGDTEDFKEAAEVAGMPDETSGFVFVNVADALPLLSLAGLAGAQVPEEVLENLRPLRSIVAWSEAEGSRATHHLFVHIQ